jgi:hypothetical protein
MSLLFSEPITSIVQKHAIEMNVVLAIMEVDVTVVSC